MSGWKKTKVDLDVITKKTEGQSVVGNIVDIK
jgi:hypothetical protein